MESMNQIIDEYGQKIYKYCYGMLRNKHEAEDATQEVFVKVYKSLDKCNEILSISSWIYRIAYNHCLNTIRRNKILSFITFKDELKNEEIVYDSYQEDNEYSEQLANALAKLTIQDRSILLLRVLEEKSYEELAQIFDKRPDAIRKQFERIRKKIKMHIETEKGVKAIEKVTVL